jgi:hypothetical protein
MKKPQSPVVRHEPIRIVPLHVAEALAAPAVPPKLTYRGGPLISAPQVFTIFWGDAWKQPAHAGLVAQLNAFFDFVLGSALIDQLAEYNVPKFSLKHGKRTGTAIVTTPTLKSSVTDSEVRTMIQGQIAAKKIPKASANTLYFVYVKPGVRVVMGGSASCQAFCGYHDAIGSKTFYAVMPYPGCNGCTGGLSAFDALTSTSSHELCEAITDAVPGTGWYDDVHGEIGDICAWRTRKIGQYTVQLEWSNKARACI